MKYAASWVVLTLLYVALGSLTGTPALINLMTSASLALVVVVAFKLTLKGVCK